MHNFFTDEINSLNSNYIENDNVLLINITNHNLQREIDTLTFSWDILFTIFDNAIIIKANNYSEMHFRNGFVRCQDVQSPDYDHILAHTYYELNIKKLRPDRENMKFKEDLDKKMM